MISAMRAPRAAGAGEGSCAAPVFCCGAGAAVGCVAGEGASRGIGALVSVTSDSRTLAVAWLALLPASDAVIASVAL